MFVINVLEVILLWITASLKEKNLIYGSVMTMKEESEQFTGRIAKKDSNLDVNGT